MSIAADVQGLDLGAEVELYVLDTTVINGADVLYFHSGVNALGNDVVWQGQAYTRWPLEASGYELTTKGTLPRPTLVVANIDGSIGALCRLYDDLVGAKITRKRTLLKYLDAVNFAGGVNPTADPDAAYADEVYFIGRKTAQNPVFVTFEMTAAWDVQGVRLPRRAITYNACPWKYRGAECGYAGTDMFDINDNVTLDPALDVCAKRIPSCKKRFGDFADLPYGGFPLSTR